GHVDHGKTSLIEALTGTNPDRLPEEKARGMTIDLGFAWFPGQEGEPIGVIDVPGHERFIRNMVAGAWSLDCALLLVAADDGWMQQTQDHAVVLAALGVPSVILAITKIDAADPARVEDVGRDSLKRCLFIFGFRPSLIHVSARLGTNVKELKSLIIETLASLAADASAPRFPYIYVDRVFVMKGSGLVVTGSLKGAPFKKDEADLVILPQGEAIRVRGVQSYNESILCPEPTSRIGLNLQKTKAEIQRGNCITLRQSPFVCETEFIARITPVEGGDARIRNHGEVEVAIGTGHEIAHVHFLEDRRFARFLLRSRVPGLWNQAFLIIRHGGSAILGSGRILWFGEVKKEARRRLYPLLAALPFPASEVDHFLLDLRFCGYSPAPSEEALLLASEGESILLEPWIFHRPWFDAITKEILKLTSRPPGIANKELEGKLHLEASPLSKILDYLVGNRTLEQVKGLYVQPGSAPSSQLAPLARRMLAEVKNAGKAAFELSRAGVDPAHGELKTLARLGLVVKLEGPLYYERGVYEEIATEVLAGLNPGERLSVPEAKERCGLSRKYMLPLLNHMEKEGWLRREGDLRIVLKVRG
ncbi:MAG: SelB C-terminal domain-containing protein, partial [Spirochaetota bacterium]